MKLDTAGWIKAKRRLAAFDRLSLWVGWTSQETYPEKDVSITAVALFQEYGTNASEVHSGIPSRPTLRGAVFDFRDAIGRAIAKAVADSFEFQILPRVALESAGRTVVNLVQRKMAQAPAWATPLAASTVKKKGHNIPLYERGLMADAVVWIVRGPAGDLSHG